MCLSNLPFLRTPTDPRPLRRRLSVALMLVLTTTVGTVFSSTAAVADPAVFFVADGASSFEIETADLIAAVPGASGSVLTTTPTGRGSLIQIGDIYQYLPSAGFFDLGSDSFHFEVATSGGSTWGTAFLVAGMRGDGAFFLPVDDLDIEDVVDVYGGNQVNPNLESPINPPYDLRFDLAMGASLFVEPKEEAGAGPTGGTIGVSIACGGAFAEAVGAEMLIATAIDANGQELARVLVVEGETGPEMVGEIRSDAAGIFTRTKNVAANPGQEWVLQWWGATAADSLDAGLLLLADGVVQQVLTGLDSPDLVLANWRFGALTNSGFHGFIQLDDLIGQGAITIPRAQPVFADNFEAQAPVWSGETCGGLLPGAVAGALVVPVDSAATNCFRSRNFSESQRQHRVRFTVNLEGAALAPLDRVSLLRSRRDGDVVAHLKVDVRRTVGGTLQVNARAGRDDGTQAILPWVDIKEDGDRLMEVHWWAAANRGGAGGGLRLTVDGVLIGEILDLANSTLVIDQMRLGVINVNEGSFGQVVFGDVEVWR